VVAEHVCAPYDDPAGLDRLADGADVVTFEFENVPAAAAERLAPRVAVRPSPRSLAVSQDRLAEKRLFAALEIPTPAWHPVDGPEDLPAALARVGLPAVLKTRRLGYDGHGQRVVGSEHDAASAVADLGAVPLIAERRVAFTRELSLLVVRGTDGATAAWPLGQNRHEGGILRHTAAPAPDLGTLQGAAEAMGRRILDELDHVGVLALELFEEDGALLANEIAPRVHNTGHWTIEGAVTSQFENHLRAVLGLPLGPTEARGEWEMENLLGAAPPLPDLLARPGAHVHLYGKASRPGRKVGHVTAPRPSAAARDDVG
jgi:5-(carboxyamino)imidazole ribonucleotide synthase